MARAPAAGKDGAAIAPKSDAWTDLALTLPIFVFYHLGVVFLPVRNAADFVTTELRALASHSLLLYGAFTLAIGLAFVLVLVTLGRGQALRGRRFALVAVEGALYALLMRFTAGYVVGSLRLGPPGAAATPFAGLVMSMGAGFYEEIAFRAGLFGVGALVLRKVVGEGTRRFVLTFAWAVACACVFSGWHYVGPLADELALPSFVFRAVCGLVLTAIFHFRGFAPAVWTHALYDAWILVLPR